MSDIKSLIPMDKEVLLIFIISQTESKTKLFFKKREEYIKKSKALLWN